MFNNKNTKEHFNQNDDDYKCKEDKDFCKSYKKDQHIIIVDFICIGLIHCIAKVF